MNAVVRKRRGEGADSEAVLVVRALPGDDEVTCRRRRDPRLHLRTGRVRIHLELEADRHAARREVLAEDSPCDPSCPTP